MNIGLHSIKVKGVTDVPPSLYFTALIGVLTTCYLTIQISVLTFYTLV